MEHHIEEDGGSRLALESGLPIRAIESVNRATGRARCDPRIERPRRDADGPADAHDRRPALPRQRDGMVRLVRVRRRDSLLAFRALNVEASK
jgi:hypothetical protein